MKRSVSFGVESKIDQCCSTHSSIDIHYSISDTPNSNIEELKRKVKNNDGIELYIFVKDEYWIGNYFKRYCVLGWDDQFEMFILECGSYLDPCDIRWVCREFNDIMYPIHLIQNNNTERQNCQRQSDESETFTDYIDHEDFSDFTDYEDGSGPLW